MAKVELGYVDRILCGLVGVTCIALVAIIGGIILCGLFELAVRFLD